MIDTIVYDPHMTIDGVPLPTYKMFADIHKRVDKLEELIDANNSYIGDIVAVLRNVIAKLREGSYE